MAIKKYYDNPKTTDTIVFDLYTPQTDGCFLANPLFFDSIKIFFISRSQVEQKDLSIAEITYDPFLERATYVATEEYCAETDQAIKQQLEVIKNNLRARLENNALAAGAKNNITFYSDANLVYCGGLNCAMQGPLWIDGDAEYNKDSVLVWDQQDTEIPYGHFVFEWTPGIIKEGDYYICYSYTTRVSQYKTQTITKYIHFYISPNIQNEISIPSHGCPPLKYITLLNAYLPKMYLENYAKQDESVFTLEALNESIAKAFTGMDDQASRLIDILNANDTPEPYLVYLAQMFQLNLRSNDVTRWRGQIITAVPQFKKKGTLQGLVQAFDQAGIILANYYQYWQINFPEVWTETFKFTGSYEFLLDKYTNDDYQVDYSTIFELYLAPAGTDVWQLQSPTLVSFSQNSDNITVMTWDSSATILKSGDIIKVTYVTQPLTSTQQSLYLYWRDYLPLMDIRPFFVLNAAGEIISKLDLSEPPKNWNTRLILETDPMFSTFIPTMNPFTNPVSFGFIRTEFPYSENVYNMDEYNGSLRVSNNPEDMGPDFIEPCSGGISAYYGLDLVVQDLSDFRVTECLGIIADYTPFHSILHTLNVAGSVEEFILPPVEIISCLMEYTISEYFIAGDAQLAFNRKSILYDFTNPMSSTSPGTNGRLAFLRNDFATATNTITGENLVLYNRDVVIKGLINAINFSNLNIDLSNNIFEILDSGNPYKGLYANILNAAEPASLVLKSSAVTTLNGLQPIDPTNPDSYFTWRVSNLVYNGSFEISNFYQYTLYDENIILSDYEIGTVNTDGSGAAWTVTLSGNIYKILYVNNNTIYLEDNPSNPLGTTPLSGVSYTVTNTQTSQVAYTSTSGVYNLCKIAKVSSLSFSLANFCIPVPSPDIYFSIDNGATQYKFYSLDPNDTLSFYILGYTIGATPASVTGQIYNRLATDYGNILFQGLYAERISSKWPKLYNPEQAVLRSELIPENCILEIDLTTGVQDYILNVDFNGNPEYWEYDVDILGYFVSVGTKQTGSGLTCGFNFFEYSEVKKPAIVPAISGETLYYITRAGQDIWSATVETASSFMFHMNDSEKAASIPGKPVDFVKNTESINFVIEYKDGEKKEGEFNDTV